MRKLMWWLAALALVSLVHAEPFAWPSEWLAEPEAANPGGTYRSATLSSARTFNPFVSAEGNTVLDTSFYTVPLIRRDPVTRGWIPYAAESFEISDDGLQATVTLRDGVAWSDGTPVTADDYVFYYTAIVDPEVASARAEDWLIGEDLITLEKVDDRTLLFTFPKPDRAALSAVATVPAPDHVLGEVYREGGAEALKAEWGTEVDLSETVWAGPWVPVTYAPDERFVFERNPAYGEWNVDWEGRPLPYFDELQYTIADQDATLNLYLAGELDLYSTATLDNIAVIANAVRNGELDALVRDNLIPATNLALYVLNWNQADEPEKQRLFRDASFRRALSHLTPREALVDLAFGGAAIPNYLPVFDYYDFWVPDEPTVYPFNPEEAKRILAELGYDEPNADGWLQNDDGEIIEFSLATIAGNSSAEQVIQIIADTMRENGVKVETQPLEFSLLVDQLTSTGDDRAFDAIYIFFGCCTEEWPYFEGIYSCTGGFHMWNQAGECLDPREERIAELVRLGRTTLDDDAAQQISYEIIEAFSELAPIIYTTTPLIHYSWLEDLGGEYAEELISPLNGTRSLVTSFKK